MKKYFLVAISTFLILISYSSILHSATSDLETSLEGRWRGITLCKWDIKEWGGGEYELGNGKFSGSLDFTIINKDGNKTLKSKRFVDFGGRTSEILSYKINKKSFSVKDKKPWDEKPYTWQGTLITNNTIELKSNDDCKSTVHRTEEISFDSFSPRNLLDYVDGVENDEKFTIPGLLTFPDDNQEKYPVMIMVMNSGCGLYKREFTNGEDILRAGVGILEIDNCKPRGLSIFNQIGAGNFNILNPWMGAADALFALKFLQNHPKVDPDKIGIMGFSWGGQVTMWTGLDIIRKSIVGEDKDFSLRVSYYPYCRSFDVPNYSKNKLHFFIGEKDAAPPVYCKKMVDSFNERGFGLSIDVFPDAHHNFDDPYWDSKPKFQPREWYVTENCNLWIAEDYTRSWRLNDMRIELDNYLDWNVRNDTYYKEYKKECEKNGVTMGRNDKASQLAATKLIKLIKENLK